MIHTSLHISERCVEMMYMYLLKVRVWYLSHMLSNLCVSIHARLFGSMCVLLHAYLVRFIFCLSLRLHALPLYARTAFMCARAQQWIWCVCKQQMLSGDCVFAQALLSCQCSHMNRQVCLISWHMFQIVFFATSCPKKTRFRAWIRSRFKLISKYILH